MSYLLQYARRPDSIASRNPAARVDEYARLNRPGLYGDAFVRVFVEDTTARRRRHDRELDPHRNQRSEKEVHHVVSEASRHAPRAAVGAAAGTGCELGRRLRLGSGRVDAAAPLPRARLRGRLLLRV